MQELSFSDISVGQEVGLHRSISAELLQQFTQLSQDYHPLHTDEEYSRKSGFEGVIAHGLLVSSLCSAIVGMHLPGPRALLLSQNFDFLLPVYVGDNLEIEAKVQRKQEALRVLVLAVSVKNQRGEEVARGKMQCKVRED